MRKNSLIVSPDQTFLMRREDAAYDIMIAGVWEQVSPKYVNYGALALSTVFSQAVLKSQGAVVPEFIISVKGENRACNFSDLGATLVLNRTTMFPNYLRLMLRSHFFLLPGLVGDRRLETYVERVRHVLPLFGLLMLGPKDEGVAYLFTAVCVNLSRYIGLVPNSGGNTVSKLKQCLLTFHVVPGAVRSINPNDYRAVRDRIAEIFESFMQVGYSDHDSYNVSNACIKYLRSDRVTVGSDVADLAIPFMFGGSNDPIMYDHVSFVFDKIVVHLGVLPLEHEFYHRTTYALVDQARKRGAGARVAAGSVFDIPEAEMKKLTLAVPVTSTATSTTSCSSSTVSPTTIAFAEWIPHNISAPESVPELPPLQLEIDNVHETFFLSESPEFALLNPDMFIRLPFHTVRFCVSDPLLLCFQKFDVLGDLVSRSRNISNCLHRLENRLENAVTRDVGAITRLRTEFFTDVTDYQSACPLPISMEHAALFTISTKSAALRERVMALESLVEKKQMLEAYLKRLLEYIDFAVAQRDLVVARIDALLDN